MGHLHREHVSEKFADIWSENFQPPFWALRMMLFMDTSYKRKSTAHSCTPDGHWLSKPRGFFSRSLGKRSVDCSFFLNFYFTFEGVFKEAKLRELCTLYVNSIFINLGITNCPRSPIVRVSFSKKYTNADSNNSMEKHLYPLSREVSLFDLLENLLLVVRMP